MKPRFINLFLAAFSLFFALCLAEIISRIFLPAPQTVIANIKQTQTIAPQSKKNILLNQHPDEGGIYKGTPTGKRLQPNRIVTIEHHQLSQKKVVIETNSIGYRNREIGEKQGKRILFLGDSVTFQDYLNEDETFVRLVERYAKHDGLNWETINAGVGAISLKTELAILKESGLQLEPDVVVLDFYLNDFQESKGVQIIKLPWYLKKSYFLYYLTQWINQQRGIHFLNDELDLENWKNDFKQQHKFSNESFNYSQAGFNKLILDSFGDFGAIWSENTWDYMKPLFYELKKLSLDNNFQLVIVVFPVYPQVYTEILDDNPQKYLKAIAGELGIPVLDALPILREEALRLDGDTIYQSTTFYNSLFYDQCHHTPEASTLIAKNIYSFLKLTEGAGK